MEGGRVSGGFSRRLGVDRAASRARQGLERWLPVRPHDPRHSVAWHKPRRPQPINPAHREVDFLACDVIWCEFVDVEVLPFLSTKARLREPELASCSDENLEPQIFLYPHRTWRRRRTLS